MLATPSAGAERAVPAAVVGQGRQAAFCRPPAIVTWIRHLSSISIVRELALHRRGDLAERRRLRRPARSAGWQSNERARFVPAIWLTHVLVAYVTES
jgi:hypothetical protein